MLYFLILGYQFDLYCKSDSLRFYKYCDLIVEILVIIEYNFDHI